MTGSAYFPREEYLAMDTLSELISIFIRKIFPLRIIISERNHPHSEESASRDYFPEADASLFGKIPFQGLFSRDESIPARRNLPSGIIFPRQKHPCSEKSPFRDYFPEAKASCSENSPVRDYFLRIKSSPYERICLQGCFGNIKVSAMAAKAN